jgi:hypothetical protein
MRLQVVLTRLIFSKSFWQVNTPMLQWCMFCLNYVHYERLRNISLLVSQIRRRTIQQPRRMSTAIDTFIRAYLNQDRRGPFLHHGERCDDGRILHQCRCLTSKTTYWSCGSEYHGSDDAFYVRKFQLI